MLLSSIQFSSLYSYLLKPSRKDCSRWRCWKRMRSLSRRLLILLVALRWSLMDRVARFSSSGSPSSRSFTCSSRLISSWQMCFLYSCDRRFEGWCTSTRISAGKVSADLASVSSRWCRETTAFVFAKGLPARSSLDFAGTQLALVSLTGGSKAGGWSRGGWKEKVLALFSSSSCGQLPRVSTGCWTAVLRWLVGYRQGQQWWHCQRTIWLSSSRFSFMRSISTTRFPPRGTFSLQQRGCSTCSPARTTCCRAEECSALGSLPRKAASSGIQLISFYIILFKHDSEDHSKSSFFSIMKFLNSISSQSESYSSFFLFDIRSRFSAARSRFMERAGAGADLMLREGSSPFSIYCLKRFSQRLSSAMLLSSLRTDISLRAASSRGACLAILWEMASLRRRLRELKLCCWAEYCGAEKLLFMQLDHMLLQPIDLVMSPREQSCAVLEAMRWCTTPMLAALSISARSVVVRDSELTTRRKRPPLGLVQVICAWKGTFCSWATSISMKRRSSSSRSSNSKEIFVFTVALGSGFTRIVRLSRRKAGSSWRKTSALCSMIFVSTSTPITSSRRIFAKSSASFSGFTTLMLPLVASTTCPNTASFELSPLIVMMFTATFLARASAPSFSQQALLLSSGDSSAPTPMLASPSVHSTTTDPLLPREATSIAAVRAGPSAVCPFASVLFSWFSSGSQLSAMGEVSRNSLSACRMSVGLFRRSPTRLTFSALPSPMTTTSLLKRTKPTRRCGSALRISLICDSMALRTHCMRETKVLFLLWAPGRKLNCASSPGSMNCLSISISSRESPNLSSTLPATSEVVFMLPEMSMQKTMVESFSLPPCSSALSSMYTTSSFAGTSSFSMVSLLGKAQNSHFQRLSCAFSSQGFSIRSPPNCSTEYLFRMAPHFLHAQGSPPARFFYASFVPSKVSTKTLRSPSCRAGLAPLGKGSEAIQCAFGLPTKAQGDAFFMQFSLVSSCSE